MDIISEAYGRGGNKELANFLSIAKWSNEEVWSQSYRAFDFKSISDNELKNLLEKTDKISRKIKNLMIYLRKTPLKGTKFK